ncbi:DUF1441 family protein [Zooshikella harenae]|uniref:DUF1441 family protein n=1 Tax=Zooshikella harenae TaxID=2827238 RepID=A0ABS5ZJX9_9GAMM|nr:DUF1441 family protein [Zooshikella harenae]MBU2714394.1 DUF1441 family protein [Zooshikella harenae]
MTSPLIEKWSISQMAQLFNMCRKTVSKRLKEMEIKPVGKLKGYDVYASDQVGPALFGNTELSDLHDPEKMTPKDRKDWFQAENERLDFELRESQLCETEDVRRTLNTVVQVLIQACETLPDHLERKCALPPKALTAVENVVNDIRQSLYHQLKHALRNE